jgi:ankyrin repeat protein
MRKWSIITGLVILGLCPIVAFPVCRGRLNARTLIKAVEQNNVALVRLLLDKGVNVNIKDSQGIPLLHTSVMNDQREITQLLLAKGADVDTQCSTTFYFADGVHTESVTFIGRTALHWAREPEQIELLLANGANINATDCEGQTPLYSAVCLGRVDTVRVFLARGAKVDVRENRWGHTPLHAAVISVEPEVVELLISHGADVDARDKRDCTPLHFAVLSSLRAEPEIVEQLPAYGAEVNAEYDHRVTQFRLSNFAKCSGVVKLLLDNGADANAQNASGMTALHLASERGHRCLVDMLLTRGADVSIKNNKGETPLDMAVQKGHSDIAELLRNAGPRQVLNWAQHI